MKNYAAIRRILYLVCLPLVLFACASDQPAPASSQILSGEQMLRESQSMAALGGRWQQGKKMVENGQHIVREGQSKISEGNRMIEEGRKIMRESEEGYKGIKN